MKTCHKCLESKDLEDFSKNRQAPDGLQYHCKTCQRLNAKKYYKNNKLHHKQIARSWQHRNPDRVNLGYSSLSNRFATLKSQAKKRRLEFTLSKDDFNALAAQNCIYCEGYFPKVRIGGGLDRVDNSKGYTQKNVVPCCGTCNMIKGKSFSLEETKVMVKSVIQFRKRLLCLEPTAT